MRIGATFPLLLSLDPAPTSTLARKGRVVNGLRTRFAEDMVLLAEIGLTEVRIPFDWARLEPRDGTVDGGEVEWIGHVVSAARSAGLGVWASLCEGPLPTWFADEGGFDDERAASRYWPRHVNRLAERFGGEVAGWFPIDRPSRIAALAHADDPQKKAEQLRQLALSWRDSWTILRGGPPVSTLLELDVSRPTDTTVEARKTANRNDRTLWAVWLDCFRDGSLAVPGLFEREVPGLVGATDRLGCWVRATDKRSIDDIGAIVRRLAEEGTDVPLSVTVQPGTCEDHERVSRLEHVVAELLDACADGVSIAECWFSPAIDPPGGDVAIIDADRQPKPSAEVWRQLGV